jgi:gamma-glutamyltranspeptidase/glutathione hydrolase
MASLAGLRMLIQRGNAVDAAVATAAALNVVEPYMSGIGGLGYMMIYDARMRSPRVLDYMGVASRGATLDAFGSRAAQEHGPKAPMVPGACAGWLTALAERGRLDRATVFAPAIEYAEQGVPLTLRNEVFFRNSLAGGHIDDDAKAVFFANGAPPAGTIIRQPKLAATFRAVVADGMDAFYRGAIAREIVASVRAKGGLLCEEDLAEFQPKWEDPAVVEYRGYRVQTPAPPCSGIQYLQTLKLLEPYDIGGMGHNSAETIHTVVEAIKLAVADRIHNAPLGPACPTNELLADDYLAERRAMIDPARVNPSEGERFDGRVVTPETVTAGLSKGTPKVPECTTHFSIIDGEGNAVAVTQSLGDGFGSGVMAGETGLMLNNFNNWFDSDPESPNLIAPGKRIEMCMSPAAITKPDGSLFAVMGTPGSFGILQTTPQMIMNVIDHGFSMQAAIEAPRFRAYGGTVLEIEARVPKVVRDELTRRGHAVRLIDDWSPLVGGGQGVMVDPDTGALLGGADPRRDGVALGF